MKTTTSPTPRKRREPEPIETIHVNRPGTAAVVRAALRILSWPAPASKPEAAEAAEEREAA